MSFPTRTDLLLLLLFGGILVALGITAWHVRSGLSPDSVTYVDAAQSLLRGQGLSHRWAYWDPVYETYQLPTRTTLWPPGYPLAIAALAASGMNTVSAARLVSFLAVLGLFVIMFGLLRYFLMPVLAVVAVFFLVTLLPLVGFYASVSSEPGFLFLGTLSLFWTLQAVIVEDRRRACYYWLVASVAAGVAFLFRYVGLSCVTAVAVTSLWMTWTEKDERRWYYRSAAVLPSGLIIATVFCRNYVTTKGYGQSVAGADVFWSTLVSSCKAVVVDLIGWEGSSGSRIIRMISVGYLGLLLALFLLAVRAFVGFLTTTSKDHLKKPEIVASCITALFMVLYLLVVVGGRLDKGMDVEPRYVTVICPWLFLLVMGWALHGPTKQSLQRNRGMGVPRSATLVYVLFVLCQGVLVGRWFLEPVHDDYVSDTKDSPVVSWLKTNATETEVILSTRGAEVAYWRPNPVLKLPRIPYSGVNVTSWDTVDQIADKAHARFLVHFFGTFSESKWNRKQIAFLRTLDIPGAVPNRQSIVFDDGVIYRVGTIRTARVNDAGE